MCLELLSYDTSLCPVSNSNLTNLATLCRPQTFTSEPEGIFQDLEKTALNPFIDSKSAAAAGTAAQGKSDEAQRQESWQQMMGERWARAIYSYYNWRTVRALILETSWLLSMPLWSHEARCQALHM